MPNPDGTPTAEEIQAAIQAGQQSKQVSQPIGVPFYQTDPSTGQPYLDQYGNPVRWSATVSGTTSEDNTRVRGRIGSQQVTQSYTQSVAPRYFDGDQWLPASLPPDQLAALQKRMVSAGLLKPGEAQLGVWDPASVNAYTKLLGYANASGLTTADALSRWEQAHAADPNQGKQPLTVKVTNPDDLRAVFRKAVIDTLGQGWDTTKIDQMVNAYQGTETSAQQQQYNMQDTGGTVVAPPDPSVYAEQQARAANPLGAQEHDLIKPGGPLDAFKQIIGGWA